MSSPTTIKGEMACLEVERVALNRHAIISRPNFETRYDRIIDWNGKLYRAQIKWCDKKLSTTTGAFIVKLTGISNGKKTKRYSEKEIDVILVYSPKTNKIYWLPISLFAEKDSINLRFEKPKNNFKNCHFAEDYIW